jgi:hypothetical protein
MTILDRTSISRQAVRLAPPPGQLMQVWSRETKSPERTFAQKIWAAPHNRIDLVTCIWYPKAVALPLPLADRSDQVGSGTHVWIDSGHTTSLPCLNWPRRSTCGVLSFRAYPTEQLSLKDRISIHGKEHDRSSLMADQSKWGAGLGR